jgi:hypothetical protein
MVIVKRRVVSMLEVSLRAPLISASLLRIIMMALMASLTLLTRLESIHSRLTSTVRLLVVTRTPSLSLLFLARLVLALLPLVPVLRLVLLVLRILSPFKLVMTSTTTSPRVALMSRENLLMMPLARESLLSLRTIRTAPIHAHIPLSTRLATTP